MNRHSFSGICIAVCFLWITPSRGAEVRKYAFDGDIPAYQFSCGECSGPPYSVRARVQGAFEASLNYEQRVGTLLSLNARLTDAEGSFGAGNWQPIEWRQEFLNASHHYDRYRPPFAGSLKPAEYRPLGPGTLTPEHWEPYIGLPGSEIPEQIGFWLSQGIGFEPAPADSWILYFDGALRSPDGTSTSIVASYNIYFEGDEALFSYYVPIDDAVPSIAAARATLVPEPAGLSAASMVLFCLAMLLRRRQHGRFGVLHRRRLYCVHPGLQVKAGNGASVFGGHAIRSPKFVRYCNARRVDVRLHDVGSRPVLCTTAKTELRARCVPRDRESLALH
jgi:hypothetical protein